MIGAVFFSRFKAKMRGQNTDLGLKESNYGASSSHSYKDKLKKLACYSVARHLAPCGGRRFQSLRFELNKRRNDSSSVRNNKKAIR